MGRWIGQSLHRRYRQQRHPQGGRRKNQHRSGNGKAGYKGDGSLALNAALNSPSALLLDSSGNIYVADELNSVIREVLASSKTIQTVAGNGQQSDSGDSGAATAAQLNGPAGASADASDNIYFADQYNNVVREVVAATGKIKTVAGTGAAGFSGDGGLAARAQLSAPAGVFVDSAGNLFIADTRNNVVREAQAATGNIVTVAGNGTPGYRGDGSAAFGAQLQGPAAVAVDRAGNLFIADTGNNVVREVTAANGQIKTVAGSGTWGYGGDGSAATSARLKGPNAILVDSSGNIFFADSGNNEIREVVASSGKILPVAGNGAQGYSGDSGPATSANLSSPSGIFMDGGGNLFIADSANHVIREVAAQSQIITTIAGTGTAGYLDSSTPLSAQFDFPTGLAGDPLGNLFVGDSRNQRIRKIAGVQGTDVIPMAAPPTSHPGPASTRRTEGHAQRCHQRRHHLLHHEWRRTYGKLYEVHGSHLRFRWNHAQRRGHRFRLFAEPGRTGRLYHLLHHARTQLLAAARNLHWRAAGRARGAHERSRHPLHDRRLRAQRKLHPLHQADSGLCFLNYQSYCHGHRILHFPAQFPGSYVIQTFVAAPTFTPAPQGYWATQSVTLQDATPGATIYYTLDG